MTTAPAPAASGAPSAGSPTPTSSAPSATSSSSTSSAPSPSAAKPTSEAPAAKNPAAGGDPGAPKPQAVDADAPHPDDTPAEAAAKEAARKLKLKINGREREYDEQEVVRLAQLSAGAHEKFAEAAEMRKQAEQFFETLLKDPKSVLLHPELRDRINMRQIAEEFLGAELQKEMMSPEQRELEELRAFKRQQDEAKAAQEHEQLTKTQQAEMQALQQRAAQEYDRKISEVLSQSNLPKNAYTVKRVAELLHGALTKGYDLDVQTAVDIVRDGYVTDLQSLVGGLDGEPLVKFLGDDLVKKLRKYDLQRLKSQMEPAQPTAPVAQLPVESQRRQPEGERNMRPHEWSEFIRKKAGV